MAEFTTREESLNSKAYNSGGEICEEIRHLSSLTTEEVITILQHIDQPKHVQSCFAREKITGLHLQNLESMQELIDMGMITIHAKFLFALFDELKKSGILAKWLSAAPNDHNGNYDDDLISVSSFATLPTSSMTRISASPLGTGDAETLLRDSLEDHLDIEDDNSDNDSINNDYHTGEPFAHLLQSGATLRTCSPLSTNSDEQDMQDE